MRREIGVQSSIDHEQVMPILDADRNHAWLVTPWAGSLTDVGASLNHGDLADALDEVAQGLSTAHASGHVHRHVTPANIFFFNEPDGRRWVVADSGLVRRPRGEMTTNLLTTTGVSVGTHGYIAPEVFTVDAHSVTEAANGYRPWVRSRLGDYGRDADAGSSDAKLPFRSFGIFISTSPAGADTSRSRDPLGGAGLGAFVLRSADSGGQLLLDQLLQRVTHDAAQQLL